MTGVIDLHTHSTASDGTVTPAELVRLSAELGLEAVALTDHDTLSGLNEFMDAGRAFPLVKTIPGIEISVRLEGDNEAHMVGLFIDPEDENLHHFLSVIRENRNRRNEEMLGRLRRMGFDISYDELMEFGSGESIGRPAVAALLVKKGYFSSMPAVFDECLRRGMPGYVPRELPSPESCIRQIHASGGVAVWAHPVYRRKNERVYVRVTLERLCALGLDGIETCYTVFTDAQHKMLCEFAERYHLLQSGGSDFHGEHQPRVQLGTGFGELRVPSGLLAPLEARHRQRLAEVREQGFGKV